MVFTRSKTGAAGHDTHTCPPSPRRTRYISHSAQCSQISHPLKHTSDQPSSRAHVRSAIQQRGLPCCFTHHSPVNTEGERCEGGGSAKHLRTPVGPAKGHRGQDFPLLFHTSQSGQHRGRTVRGMWVTLKSHVRVVVHGQYRALHGFAHAAELVGKPEVGELDVVERRADQSCATPHEQKDYIRSKSAFFIHMHLLLQNRDRGHTYAPDHAEHHTREPKRPNHKPNGD